MSQLLFLLRQIIDILGCWAWQLLLAIVCSCVGYIDGLMPKLMFLILITAKISRFIQTEIAATTRK